MLTQFCVHIETTAENGHKKQEGILGIKKEQPQNTRSTC